MKDVVSLILYLGLILFVAYSICLGLKSRVEKVKIRKEELRKEGKLLPPKQALMNAVKIYGSMIGSSLIISIIVLYVRKVEFSTSNIFWGTITFIMFECIIGGAWGFIQNVIKTYKKEGALGTIVILIMFIMWAIAFVYVKYHKILN